MVLLGWDAGQRRLKARWKTQQWNGVRSTNPKNLRLRRSMEARYICFLNVGGQVPCSLLLPVNGSLSRESVDYALSVNKCWNVSCLGSSVYTSKGVWCCITIPTSATIWEESWFSSPVLLRLFVCSVRSPEMQKCCPLLPTVKTLKVLENNCEAIALNF